MEQMVRGCRPEVRGECGTPGVREFVRMDLRREACGLRTAEDSPPLVRREISVVNEHIAIRSEPSRRDRIDHFAAHEIDVGVDLTLEFRGNRMGPEEGPDDIDAGDPAGLRRGAQDLELVGGPESISALHLDRRRPEGEHRSESFGGSTDQVFLGGGPRRSHGVEDAAPASRNLSVPEALRLPVDLVLPRSGEDGMRVRVHEAGQDRLSRRVDRHTRAGMSTEDVRGRTDVDNPLALGVQGSILYDPEFAGRFVSAGARPAAQGEEFPCVLTPTGWGFLRSFLAGRADLVGLDPSHEKLAPPIGSDLTTNAFPPAARIASVVSAGRSESATMLPPPPAPVSFAPWLVF